MVEFSYSLTDPTVFTNLEAKLTELDKSGTLMNYNVRVLTGDKGNQLILEEKKTGIVDFFKRLFDKSYNLSRSVQTILQTIQGDEKLLSSTSTNEVLHSLNKICDHVNSKRWLFKVNTAPIEATSRIIQDKVVAIAAERLFKQKEEIKQFIKQLSTSPEKWLRKALQARPELGADFIESTIIPNLENDTPIAQRFQALKAEMAVGQFEKAPLRDSSIFLFALFCEECIRVKACGVQLLSAQITGLHRPVLVDWTQRAVYILSDAQASSLQAAGTYKKVTNAVRAPLDVIGKQAAEAAVAATIMDVSKEAQADVAKELAFHDALQGVSGIAEVYTVTHVKDSLSPIVLMYKKAHQGNLDSFLSSDKRHTLNVKKGIHDIVSCVKGMHARHVVHLDLKGANILVDKQGNLFVTDFGMSFFSNGPQLRDNYAGKNNYYPAKWHSAPELLFRDPKLKKFGEVASEKDYQVAENFSVGCILYNLHFGNPPSWEQEIINHVNKSGWDTHMTEAEKASIRTKMQNAIEEPFARLPRKAEERTEKQHYEYAILQMMRVKPEDRWTPAQAETYLKAHAPLGGSMSPTSFDFAHFNQDN